MVFSPDGTKLVSVGFGIIDLYDFNRCTGELSNWRPLAPLNFSDPTDYFYGCSFSPDGSKMYVSAGPDNGDFGHIYQFDLNAPNILSSRTTLYSNISNAQLGIGQHQLGPDNKIYISTSFGGIPIQYDTVYNRNISVINYPDSLGMSCNLQMFSVPVGTGRTVIGLPNFPNYDLGAMEDNCDSMNSVYEITNGIDFFEVAPNPAKNNFYLKFESNREDNYSLILFDISGHPVITINDKAVPGTNSNIIGTAELSPGIYFLEFTSAMNREIMRVIIE